MAEKLNKDLSKLSKRGPHRVLVGELDYAGVTGTLYIPEEGTSIPAVAFGHDWMTDVKYYKATLRHLASWGIAVAAPNTEKGLLPDHRDLANDLLSALQIIAGVKLGQGNVTVDPKKLGLAGHGMGAGAAILAAAHNPQVRAVGALYPAVTSPSSEDAARGVEAPGLILGSGEDALIETGNPAAVALAWKGDVVYREVKKGNQQGFSENTLAKLALGLARPQVGARETARGLLTGFLLHQLDGQKKYAAFSDPEAVGRKVETFDSAKLAERAGLWRDGSIPLRQILAQMRAS